MKPLTIAQMMYLHLFKVPETNVLFGHKLGRSESNTKRGPGRKHKQGQKTSNQR